MVIVVADQFGVVPTLGYLGQVEYLNNYQKNQNIQIPNF